MSKYEVQTYVLCDGWVNAWKVIDSNGKEVPETFDTQAEAAAALDEFLQDIQDEIDDGEREEENGYCREDFRVMPVRSPKAGV